MPFNTSASKGGQVSPWLTSMSVALIALLPSCAQAFPFIAAGGGAVILPYVLAMLAGLMRSKFAITATTMSLLAGYWLIYAPYDYVTDTYSFEENRLAGMLGERVHSIRNVRMTAPDLTKGVDFPELSITQSRVLFVNDGGLAWRNGYEAEFILSNQRFLTKDTILVSAGAELAETVANATGTRWLKGGLIGVLKDYAQRSGFPELDTSECDQNSKCAKIGVLGPGFFMRFSGFPYNSKDRMIDLHEIMMPNGGGIEVLKRYQSQGRHLSLELYDYPGHELDKGMFNYLHSQGITNVSVHYYDEQAKTRGNIDVLASRFGGSNKHLDLADIDFLCQNDTSFVMAFDGKMNTSMLFPETLRENCEAIFLPVEGMLPHQITAYIKEHPLPQHQRFVGIYTDKSTAFYTKMMLGLMTDQGYPVVGITSLDKEHIYLGNPIKQVVDSGLLALSEQITGADGRPSTLWIAIIFSILFAVTTMAFMMARHRLAVMLAWSANLGAMLLLNFFARYIPNDLTADIFEVCVIIAMGQFLLTIAVAPRLKSFTKLSGLEFLRKLGFSTPPSRHIRKFDQRLFNRLLGRSAGPLIFRSCASGENFGGYDSGRFTSVVARSPYDFDLVARAWQEMSDASRTPGFIVQPYVDFEVTGAVSSVRDAEGRMAYVIETSEQAEGVTGALDVEFNQAVLTREALTASHIPLHKDVITLHKALQGHFLAEFGIREGKVTWLQVMRQQTLLRDHRAFHEAGYAPSALNDHVDLSTHHPMVFMSKAVIGINYLVHQGRVFEKTNPLGNWINSMAFIVPWGILSWLIDRAKDRIIGGLPKEPSATCIMFWARVALVVDQITIGKGMAERGVPDQMTARYAATFGTSDVFLESSAIAINQLAKYKALDNKNLQPGRINLELQIRDAAREVVQIAYAIECSRSIEQSSGLTWSDSQEPFFKLDENLVCSGSRVAGSGVLDLRHSASEGMQEVSRGDALTVILTRADLSILLEQEHIACIRLEKRPAYTSHFVQRCLAHGIQVELLS